MRRLGKKKGAVALAAAEVYQAWRKEVERRVEKSHTKVVVRSDKVRYVHQIELLASMEPSRGGKPLTTVFLIKLLL